MGAMPYNRRGPWPPFEEDTKGVSPVGNGGSDVVYRLREGIERFLITDINNPAASNMAQSDVAIMWDLVSSKVDRFNHIPGGANVLYMDGHVSFLKYPSEKAPVTKEVALVSSIF